MPQEHRAGWFHAFHLAEHHTGMDSPPRQRRSGSRSNRAETIPPPRIPAVVFVPLYHPAPLGGRTGTQRSPVAADREPRVRTLMGDVVNAQLAEWSG